MIQRVTGNLFVELPKIEAGGAAMVFMDLPYGTTKAYWDQKVDLARLWPLVWRVLRPNGVVVATAQQPYTTELINSQLTTFRYEWIWEKTNATGFLNANKMPLKAHENVLVFYKKLPAYTPVKTAGHPRKTSTASHRRNSKKSILYGDFGLIGYDSTERYPRSVLKFNKDKQKNKKHATRKPLELLKYLISTYTNKGDLVIDPVCGSNSTLEAAEELGRDAIGIDLREF